MIFMSAGKAFLDTNVLIYAYDRSAGVKHERATEVVSEIWKSRTGLISTQVLQEFYVTVTRKISRPLDQAVARQIIVDLSCWEVVITDPKFILDAIDLQHEHMLSFWDAMIIAAAVKGGAEAILTEDLNHGQVISGVRVHNPFISTL
jgi:predicted nucleic acid-binding protein